MIFQFSHVHAPNQCMLNQFYCFPVLTLNYLASFSHSPSPPLPLSSAFPDSVVSPILIPPALIPHVPRHNIHTNDIIISTTSHSDQSNGKPNRFWGRNIRNNLLFRCFWANIWISLSLLNYFPALRMEMSYRLPINDVVCVRES